MLKDVLYLETQRKGLVKHMKKITDKQLLMGADFAGFPLKEAIKEYLEKKGWTITDIGVTADSDPNDIPSYRPAGRGDDCRKGI